MTVNASTATPARVLLAVLATALLLGCQEDVTAVVGTGYPFELYGVLDPTADTQFVRVAPIEHALRSSTPELDAAVTSTDLETGTAVAWRDSVLAYADGTYGHVYWAPFTPVDGHTYRLEASRSDEVRSSAVVAVPALPDVLVPRSGAGPALPVRFGAAEVGPLAVAVDYFVVHGWCAGEWRPFTFDYRRHVDGDGDLQQVVLRFDQDWHRMRDSLLAKGRFNWTVGIVPQRVTLRVTVGDGAWRPPGGTFDPDLLVEPGTMTNVENGFGYVGGGYTWETTLFETSGLPGDPPEGLPREMMEDAGFTLEIEKPPPVKDGICVPYP